MEHCSARVRVWGGVLILLLASGLLAQDKVVQVTAGALNVRSGPSTGYAKIGLVYNGQRYVSVQRSGSWHKVWFNGGTGWVHGGYVSEVSGSPQKVTASLLNVRRGPSTGYGVVGQAGYNSRWVVVGNSGSWRKIYYGGATRWVHGNYLSGVGGTTAAPPPTTGGLPGSSAGFVQLPASGQGFYAYSSSGRRWGTPAMVYGMMNAASAWKSQNPSYPRISIGDISATNGGYFPPHVSHRYGKDVDYRPVSNSSYEGPLTIWQSNYSSYRNRRWITEYAKKYLNVKVIGFQDAAIYNSLWYVQNWSGHHNHHHLRIH